MLALVAGIIVVVHLPVVQRAAWERGAEAVGRATGWQIEAAEFRARLWPATVELRGLRAGAPDPGAVVAERVAVRFRWGGVLASPRRIEAIEIEGLSVDLRGLDLPRTEPDPDRPAADPWHSIEIGSLEVRGARLGAAASDVELGLDDVELSGGIEDGMAHVTAHIGAIVAVRQGRRLVVGPLDVVASARRAGGRGRAPRSRGRGGEWIDHTLDGLRRPPAGSRRAIRARAAAGHRVVRARPGNAAATARPAGAVGHGRGIGGE